MAEYKLLVVVADYSISTLFVFVFVLVPV